MPVLPAILLALLAALGWSAEDAVVVNPGVDEAGIDEAGLRDIFLGRRATWGNGQRIVIVLLKEGPSNDRLSAVLDKTPQQLLNWWKRMVFTGEGLMPVVVASEKDLLQHVAATPGSIGWVERTVLAPGVRELPVADSR